MNTELLPEKGLVLCAVSGGVDSMYLLCRLAELGYPVAAAHYHHGIRGAEADRDEAFVRAFCRARAIPFLSERGDVPGFADKNRMGVEEAARALRYAFLERAADAMGAAVIATAHTADDNAETILLHLTRGAGLRGLAGIPPVRGRVVRPMLEVTRAEAERYLASRGVPHVEDSTNAGDGYARNRIRHTVVPALTEENPALVRTLSRTAALLREDEEYLSALAEAFVRENAADGALPAAALTALPRPVASRAVRIMAGAPLSQGHVRAILEVAAGGGMTDVSGLRAARAGDRLVFRAAKSEPLAETPIDTDGITAIPGTGLAVRCGKIDLCPPDVYKSFNTFHFKYENICGNMTVASRREGDRYRPAGRGCTKTLKQLFAEGGVPAWARDGVPLLRDGGGVLGGYGLPPAERVCARPGDRDVLRIEFIPAKPDAGGQYDP